MSGTLGPNQRREKRERGEHAKRQRHITREGTSGGHGRRRADRGEGNYGLQVVQGGEAAMPEGRQALAHKAGGSGGLPEAERASQDTRRAAFLLLTGARQRAGHRPEHRHPPPSGRSLLPSGGG